MSVPLSGRALPALVLTLVVALAPTMLHSYGSFQVPFEPLTSDMLPVALEGAVGRDVERSSAWVRETYGATSWLERQYGDGRDSISVFVARGYDLKKLYHHPELGTVRGTSFRTHQLVRLSAAQPVHVLRNDAAGPSVVYALIYDREWVANAYRLQIESALATIWKGRQSLTLILVYGNVVELDGALSQAAVELLTQLARSAEASPRAERPQ